jgi:hypothetical protein
VRRLAPLLALVVVLTACGGGSSSQPATTTAVPSAAAAMRALAGRRPELAGTVRTLFQGSSWAVVQSSAGGKAHAVVFRLVGGVWKPDESGRVRVDILGPRPGADAPALPQVAVEVRAPTPFRETALWLDGRELAEKGGGSPTRGTIYGAAARELPAGMHVAVGYARTATTGTAVAWVFRVG